jgi:hypothetical protein
MKMHTKRIDARDRTMIEIELRRASGGRALAAMAAVALLALGVISALPDGSGTGALGLHTESYEYTAPAAVEAEYRRDAIAVGPATGVYEEPELVVQYEVHG